MFRAVADHRLYRAVNLGTDAVQVQICRDLLYVPGRVFCPGLRSEQAVFFARDGKKDHRTLRLLRQLAVSFGNRKHLGNAKCIVGGTGVDLAVQLAVCVVVGREKHRFRA